MEKLYRIPLLPSYFAFIALAAVAFCACGRSDKTPSSLPPEVKNVVKAAKDKSPQEFAAVCEYPVERPYPLRDVADSIQMVEYYDVLVDDSLRNVVASSKPSDWDKLGWRGYTLLDGSYLWIDGRVYSIPYVSKAEKQLITSLSEEEMKSLPPQMRQGWHPAGCLMDTVGGTIFRIDANSRPDAPSDSAFRLSVYPLGADLSAMPGDAFAGFMRVEGSAGVRTYYFRDAAGNSMEYSPDDTGGDSMIVFKPSDGSPMSYKVLKTYWRDRLAAADTVSKVISR